MKEDLRLTIYRNFAEHGDAGSPAVLAGQLDATENEVREQLHELARERHLVLGDDGSVVMAHPFAAVPLGFSVMGTRTLWWGGCAWDSFAMPHLLTREPGLLVATRCPACDTPHAWVVDRDRPPPGDQVAHFLVPTAHIWDDVVHSCRHQQIFCHVGCVHTWLQESGNELGYVLSLETLWRLAAGWYEGRLERGYRRKDPATAAAYFRQVGLTGPFWGL